MSDKKVAISCYKFGKIIFPVTIFLFSAVMAIAGVASLAAQEYPDIRILDYKHGRCLVDGKEIRPLTRLEGGFYDVEIPSEGYNQLTLEDRLQSQRISCHKYIDGATLVCEEAVQHTLSNTEREYPECIRLFKSWVPPCLEHYRGQRPKCEANMRRYAQASETERSEESDSLAPWPTMDTDLESSCRQVEEAYRELIAGCRKQPDQLCQQLVPIVAKGIKECRSRKLIVPP